MIHDIRPILERESASVHIFPATQNDAAILGDASQNILYRGGVSKTAL